MINTSINIISLLYIVITSIGMGLLCLRKVSLDNIENHENYVVSLGIGIIIYIYGITFLAFMQLLDSPVVNIFLIVYLIISFAGINHRNKYNSETFNYSIYQKIIHSRINLILSLIIIFFSLIFILSASAPILDGDTMHTYLDVPRRYMFAGGIIHLPYEPFGSIPLNVQMFSILGLILRGDELSQILAGAFMAIGSASVIFIISKRYFSIRIGLIAIILFFSSFVVLTVVPTAKISLGRAYFDLLAIYAILIWAYSDKNNYRWLIISGLFNGVGLGTAHASAFTVISLLLFVVWRTIFSLKINIKERLVNSFISCVLFSIPVLLFSLPWFVKSWIETNNPFFPVFNDYFGILGTSFSEDMPQSYEGLSNYLYVFWKISVGYIVGGLGKPIGPIFLGVLPGLLFIKKIPKKIKLFLIYLLIACSMWYFIGVQRPRHLLTEIGILSIVCSWLIIECNKIFPTFKKIIISCILIFIIFNQFFFLRLHFYNFSKAQYIMGNLSREQFLEKNLNIKTAVPNWSMINYINQLPSNENVVYSLYITNDYYISPYVTFIESRSADGLFFNDHLGFPNPLYDMDLILDQLISLKVNYIFINEYYLGDKPYKDYQIINSSSFKENYLQLAHESNDQYLYRFMYEGKSN